MLVITYLLVANLVGATSSISNRESWTRDSTDSSLIKYTVSIVGLNQRRQAEPANDTVKTRPGTWDEMTKAACLSSLGSSKGAVRNPSGVAVCYNLPFLDNATGVFQADLRLFMMTEPTGSFAKIPSENIQLGLSYDGATVSPINLPPVKRGVGNFLDLKPENEKTEIAKRATEPKLLQTYTFVGQINKSLLGNSSESTNLRKVLIPKIFLSAVDSTGAAVNTSLSEDETNFVNGVFAEDPRPTQAQLAPPIQTLVVAPDAPFVVPGLSILVFPVGLIITGLWVILFVATITVGTLGRIQYRNQFNQLKQREAKGSLRTI